MLTTIDTLKFKLPAHLLQAKQLPTTHYKHIIDSDGGELYKLRDSVRMPGITSATYNPPKGEVVCEISSKILSDQYLQGITSDTIEQAMDALLHYTALPLSIADAIQYATVFKCDTVNMVHIPELLVRPKMVVDTLTIAKLNENYHTVPHRREGQNIGIEFNGMYKSFKARQIHYHKHVELARNNAKNRAFFRNCQHPAEILRMAAGMWRVETNSTEFDKIRERHNIKQPGEVYLTQLLASEQKLNYNMLQLITEPHKVNTLLTLFNSFDPERYSWHQLITEIGIRGVLQHVNYQDTKQLQAFIRAYCNTDSAYKAAWYGRTERGKVYPGMRDYVRQLQKNQVQDKLPAGGASILERIKQQLAA